MKGFLLAQDQNVIGQVLALMTISWKQRTSCHVFKDHFWSAMFMMFHLNVFYLPILKQVVGQYKMWNDVIFWFWQMIFYTKQEQYVLPTIKEIKYSLVKMLVSNEYWTMSLTAVIYHQIEDINFWSSSTLNNILIIANNLYINISIRCSVLLNDYLLLTDAPCIVSISNKLYT